MTKRVRLFAGPNGSGKSTLINILEKRWLGVYINPDEIEKYIKKNNGCFEFKKFNIIVNKTKWESHIKKIHHFLK